LDRFGRILDQRWLKTSDGSHTDRLQYGHDRDGNRLYRDNRLNDAFDELYHANGAANGYDPLNQLAEFRRGALSDTNGDGVPDTVATASRSQVWSPDAVGNFTSVTTDGTAQGRTHNRQNELTVVGTSNLAYDGNGNLTTDETGQTLSYGDTDMITAASFHNRDPRSPPEPRSLCSYWMIRCGLLGSIVGVVLSSYSCVFAIIGLIIGATLGVILDAPKAAGLGALAGSIVGVIIFFITLLFSPLQTPFADLVIEMVFCVVLAAIAGATVSARVKVARGMDADSSRDGPDRGGK
jgi:hypothetical protein